MGEIRIVLSAITVTCPLPTHLQDFIVRTTLSISGFTQSDNPATALAKMKQFGDSSADVCGRRTRGK